MFQFNCTFTWHVIYHCYALRFPRFSRIFRTNSILSPWRYLDQETCRGWLYVLLLFFVCRKPTLLVTHPLPYVKGNFLRWSIQIIGFSFWFVYNFMVSLENSWFIHGRASKLNLDMHLALTTRIFIRPRLLLQCPFQFHMKDFPIKLPSMKARVTEVVLLSPWSLWDRKVDKQTCNQHM